MKRRGRPRKEHYPHYQSNSGEKLSAWFASYEELYPLRPITSITIKQSDSLPTRIILKDKDSVYTCILRKRTVKYMHERIFFIVKNEREMQKNKNKTRE